MMLESEPRFYSVMVRWNHFVSASLLSALALSSSAKIYAADSEKTETAQPADEDNDFQAKENAHETMEVKADRIIDATSEGTRSYAPRALTIGLGEHSSRETANSVSVITRQRIEDQNLFSLEDAMQYTTGMKFTTYGTVTSGIESRGYGIDHYMIDGISSSARVYEDNFGLAIYDRVEVLRGPSGLLQGAGDPGGTINFVRKRAQKTLGLSAKTAYGSWNNFYQDLDVTGGITEDGRLRARFVAAYQDKNYYTDHARTSAPLVYGTVEYDIAPRTTISLGTTWQRNQSTPFFGLPAFDDGNYPDISRSTFVGASWNRSTQTSNRSFAELEHTFSGDSKLKISVANLVRNNESEIAWGSSFVDHATGNFEVIPYYSTGKERELNVSAVVTTPFEWLGFKQEVNWGADYQKFTNSSAYNGSTWGQNGFIQNIYNPEIKVPKPDIAIDPASHGGIIQSGAFGQLRIKPWQPLTLLAGARLSWITNQNLDNREADMSTNAQPVPYAGAIFDINEELSVYGSLSSIFAPQSDKKVDGQFLEAREGTQYELGIKGEHFRKRLLSSLALYEMQDKNRAMPDPSNQDFAISSGKVRSRGVEAELTGLVTAQWNITAGYGYNETKQLKAAPDQQGKPFTNTFPKNTFSLWTDYRWVEGWAEGTNFGFGVKVRSAIFTESDGIRSEEGSVSTYSTQLGYQVSQQIKFSLTVNNLFDKKYIDRPENWTRQTYFGEPRNILASLSYKN